MSTRLGSPLYIWLLVVALMGSQGYAFVRQWQIGFRPFYVAPQRVALSWDMFAVKIERCGIEWDPPTYWNGKSLGRFRDLGATFEWDPVYNRREDYINAATIACGMKAPGPVRAGARFSIHCFGSGREEIRDEFSCPQTH